MKKDRKASELVAEVEKLPPKAQCVICWIIENIDLVSKMCSNLDMTDSQIEEGKKDAIEKENYLKLALLSMAKTYRK